MRRNLIFVSVSLLALVVLAAPAGAESKAGRWMLDMEHGPLRTVVLERAGSRPAAYHYMTIKVTNDTGFARPWHPMVKAITDTKDPKTNADRVYIAGGFPEAMKAIRSAEGNSKLVALGTTAGKIANGTTIEGVAVFGPLDALYDHIRVEIHGLVEGTTTYKVSNYGEDKEPGADDYWSERVIVDSAYWDHNQAVLKRLRKAAQDAGSDDLPQPKTAYHVVSERRFFEMRYERLGDEFRAEDDLITFKEEGWKVDGTPRQLRIVNAKK